MPNIPLGDSNKTSVNGFQKMVLTALAEPSLIVHPIGLGQ